MASGGEEPQHVRIGKLKFKYNYHNVGPGLYKCERGSDNAPDGYVLWMEKKADGTWVAYDAPVAGSVGDRSLTRFQSSENVLTAGWHKWQFSEWPGQSGNFETTVWE